MQWVYKKGHSTELLLVKMTKNWRTALDKNQVVGDFKKAFDSVSHALLLQKLQRLGIAGDLWLWIMDYLNDRKMVLSCPLPREDLPRTFTNLPSTAGEI